MAGTNKHHYNNDDESVTSCNTGTNTAAMVNKHDASPSKKQGTAKQQESRLEEKTPANNAKNGFPQGNPCSCFDGDHGALETGTTTKSRSSKAQHVECCGDCKTLMMRDDEEAAIMGMGPEYVDIVCPAAAVDENNSQIRTNIRAPEKISGQDKASENGDEEEMEQAALELRNVLDQALLDFKEYVKELSILPDARTVRMEDSNDEISIPNGDEFSVEKSSSRSKLWLGQRKGPTSMKRVLFLLVLFLLLGAVVVGGVCGSGKCTSVSSSKPNKAETKGSSPPTAISVFPPTPGPFDEALTRPMAFTTTEELYQAVDEYMMVMNDVDTTKTSPVALKYGYPIGARDVSQITNFTRVFDVDRNLPFSPLQLVPVSDESTFNESLKGWNVSSATTMKGMFRFATAFEGMGLSTWDLSSVVEASSMFSGAHSFNADLSLWDTSSIQDTSMMFFDSVNFNGDLSSWMLTGVERMDGMFQRSFRFNNDISSWNLTNVQSMREMFKLALTFDQNLCDWGRQFELEVVDVKQIFAVSGCQTTLEPDGMNGPWCQHCDT